MRDWDELVACVAGVLVDEPDLTANGVARQIADRRSDVLRAVRVLRSAQATALPPDPATQFRNCCD